MSQKFNLITVRILKMPFDAMSLTMKATTVSCDVHKFSTNLHKHSLKKCKILFKRLLYITKSVKVTLLTRFA